MEVHVLCINVLATLPFLFICMYILFLSNEKSHEWTQALSQTSQKFEQIVFELVSEIIKDNLKSCIYVFTFLQNKGKVLPKMLKIYSDSGLPNPDFVSSSEQIVWLKTSEVVYCTWLQSIKECLVKWRDVCLWETNTSLKNVYRQAFNSCKKYKKLVFIYQQNVITFCASATNSATKAVGENQ